MKRVKTYSRSVMDDDRLRDLGTLSINRERWSRINAEDIVDDFTKLANRRIALKQLISEKYKLIKSKCYYKCL